MTKKYPLLKYVWLLLLLFAVFLSYRLYFWGDLQHHFTHSLLNALGDTLFSASGGLLVYKVRTHKGIKRTYAFLLNSVIVVGLTFGLYFYHVAVYNMYHMLSDDFRSLFEAVCFQLLDSMAIIVTGTFAVIIENVYNDQSEMQRKMTELKQQKMSEELKYLKAQLDPHFIFNSLNTIFYQINDKDMDAKQSILQFSEILRYHICQSKEEKVSFQKELQYIQSYVQFQSTRRSDFTEIKSRYEVANSDFEIEPLLLLPLIENAFKFGKGTSLSKGLVSLFLKFDGERLLFHISNSYNQADQLRLSGIGVGLQNVSKRLQLLYCNHHRFITEQNEEQNLFTCKLEIWK